MNRKLRRVGKGAGSQRKDTAQYLEQKMVLIPPRPSRVRTCNFQAHRFERKFWGKQCTFSTRRGIKAYFCRKHTWLCCRCEDDAETVISWTARPVALLQQLSLHRAHIAQQLQQCAHLQARHIPKDYRLARHKPKDSRFQRLKTNRNSELFCTLVCTRAPYPDATR